MSNLDQQENNKQEEKVNAEAPKSADDQLAEMKDLLLRTQANFENYRKQVEKRVEDLQQMAVKETILEILPIIDNFELAFKNMVGDPCDLHKGMELIYAQLMSLLENWGVKPINTDSEKYDPYFHEALMKVESEKPENMIVEEFQKGYSLNGQVLRHAKVKLSAGKKDQTDKIENKNTPKNNTNGGS